MRPVVLLPKCWAMKGGGKPLWCAEQEVLHYNVVELMVGVAVRHDIWHLSQLMYGSAVTHTCNGFWHACVLVVPI